MTLHEKASPQAKRLFKTLEEIYHNIHKEKYNYSKSVYLNKKTKMTIICPSHKEFTQTPANHKSGQGCPKCAKELVADKATIPKEEFFTLCDIKHNNFYSYDKTTYKNGNSILDIICPKHGPFTQKANKHKTGQGCNDCGILNGHEKLKIRWKQGDFKIRYNDRLVYENRQTTLYYIKVNELYKIGLTMSNIKTRFSSDMKSGIKIDIINSWTYGNGALAWDKEQEILEKYKNNKYIGENILRAGNTELFNINIYNKKDKIWQL